MLLFYVTVLCSLYGSSAELLEKETCYGNNFTLPLTYTPPHFTEKLYMTLGDYGIRRLVMDYGKSQDRRLKVSNGSAVVPDLTEDATFSVVAPSGRRQNVIKVTIKDCRSWQEVSYGEQFSLVVPTRAHYLEFIPLGSITRILWNRTNPRITAGDRGQMKYNIWTLNNVIHADTGYYNFRAKDGELLSKVNLEKVKVHQQYYEIRENENFNFRYPSGDTLWDVTYTSLEEKYRGPVRLLSKSKVTQNNPFLRRVQTYDDGFEIFGMKGYDDGTFEFRDQHNEVAQIVDFIVIEGNSIDYDPVYVNVGIGVGIVLGMIVCCCCVRKCCCKKSSSKSDQPAPETAAAPDVYYHGTSGPAGPTYSAAPTRDISVQPFVNRPVNVHVNPPQPAVHTETPPSSNVAPPGEGFNLSLGSDWLSSNPEPTFQLKGMASAPPLSSDATFSSVYTSDKLNF